MTGQANPAAAEIPLRRAYDLRAGVASVGARLLGDRLWPRGFAKTDLPLDTWLKDITPSTTLPKWFSHDRAKWAGFRQDYLAELQAEPQAVETAPEWCHKGPVTLIYAAKDREHMDDGRPLLKYSSASPLRSSSGNPEMMAAFVGRIAQILAQAQAALTRLDRITGGTI